MGVFVYAWYQRPNPKKVEPLDEWDYEDAKRAVDRGLAEWRSNRRAIQICRDAYDIRGLSCNPKEFVVQAAAEGKRWAILATKCWRVMLVRVADSAVVIDRSIADALVKNQKARWISRRKIERVELVS